ncbi:MAG TPA: methylcobamide--CoM methyltransferase, partial [Candidatus Methanomethylophilaceae archaeon]|nr:methylcobamide--CoM methyltransferase [Candidatus Methanomethylophilaceae archaeon]
MSLARNSIVRDASLKIVEESKKNNLPTVIGVTGPFTIAGHLVGTDDLLLALLLEPDYAKEVVGFTAGYMKMWLREVDTWGADTIQMSEPTASYDMLNQEMFREFALPYLQDIYRVMDNTMKVLHICGNMLPMLDEMAATGADGLSVEEKTDPYEAVKKVNKKAALIGNVGVVKPLLQGTPEDVVIATKRSMDAGFNIISAACGLSALIDRENLLAMTRTVKGE